MLTDPVVNLCGDQTAITHMLAQVGLLSQDFSTTLQTSSSSAGLLMFHPGYWAYVAGDMDIMWPGNDYTLKVLTIGKALFQDPRYAWRAVAAWYKRTNSLIANCGDDLFYEAYET
jgi:hypothetical protein